MVNKLKLALTQALLNWEDHTTDGWKPMKDILRDAPNWKSQSTNFPRHIKQLYDDEIVEERTFKDKDERNRPRQRKQWRLRRSQKSLANIIFTYADYDTYVFNSELSLTESKKALKKYGDLYTSQYLKQTLKESPKVGKEIAHEQLLAEVMEDRQKLLELNLIIRHKEAQLKALEEV